MIETTMKKVNNGFLRYFGDTKKAKLFNNEIDILPLLIILTVFIVLRPLMLARKKNDIGGC
jgi:hypothetical protein